MLAPSSPRNADGHSTRVPKLAYRKAIPEDEIEDFRRPSTATAAATANTRLSNNAGQTQASRGPGTKSALMPTASLPAKKKGSFLGGLFVKEPTLTALAQVEADLRARHGAATPQHVPHVSSRKIPEYVPKVNQKWDGLPEAVKQREREGKQRGRISPQSNGLQSQSFRSCSRDGSPRNSRQTRSSHCCGLREGESPNSHSEPVNGRCRQHSMYSTWSEESQELRDRHAASVRSQSLRSPSGASLPEISSFFPHHQEQRILVAPQRWQSVLSTSSNSTESSDQSRADYSQREHHNVAVQTIPEHSSSPSNTPRELSPVTPTHLSNRTGSPIQTFADTTGSELNASQHSNMAMQGKIDAFLAGEAQPLMVSDDRNMSAKTTDLPLRRFQQGLVDRVEPDIAKRPDSSRDRLGLRATMVIRTEAAPWEAQDPARVKTAKPPSSPHKHRLPKALARFKS